MFQPIGRQSMGNFQFVFFAGQIKKSTKKVP